jgi:hypothetical protein
MDNTESSHGDFSTSAFIPSDHRDLSGVQHTVTTTQTIGMTTAVTAADIGRKGGSSRSLVKRLAAQTNGKLGGRPRKTAASLSAVGDIGYDEIKRPRKVWETFSPTQMCEYQEKVFAYYRRVGFPFKFTDEEVQDDYRKLVNFDYRTKVSGDTIEQVMHGQTLCWSFHPHAWSVRCGKMLTPTQAFRDDSLLRKVIAKRIKYGDNMSDAGLRKALKTFSGVQAVSNFRALAAAAIYDLLLPAEGGHVYDPSMGWGGRLLGALICDKVKSYTSTDPSKATWVGNEQLKTEYNKRGIPVVLGNLGSENVRPDPDSIDLVLTSPPYFSQEKYSDEPTQSFAKFRSQDEWMNNFMKRTLDNCNYCLKPDGLLAINIADVKSYPTLENDFVELAAVCGFRLVRTLRLALSAMMGTRQAGGDKFKYEPIFIFRKAL